MLNQTTTQSPNEDRSKQFPTPIDNNSVDHTPLEDRSKTNSRQQQHQQSWTRTIQGSTLSLVHNPLQLLTEPHGLLDTEPNPDKPSIRLTMGDPTIYGNMGPSSTTVKAVSKALKSGKYHGYTPGAGMPEAREAVAGYLNWLSTTSSVSSSSLHKVAQSFKGNDVFLTHGATHALDVIFAVICTAGISNLLIPQPMFPMYITLCKMRNIEFRPYKLLPERQFEADLERLERLIDKNTAGILVTNPGNPHGWVYSRQYLQRVVDVARKHQIPVVADEIYAEFVFNQTIFVPLSSVSEDVPIITCGGLTKTFFVPGWRIGWIALSDPMGVFEYSVRHGIVSMLQCMQAPCSFVQAALPAILDRRSSEQKSHLRKMIDIVARNATTLWDGLHTATNVEVIKPQGSMYALVMLNKDELRGALVDDIEFCRQLIREQSVYCYPGSVFGLQNSIRLVLTLPEAKMKEAVARIATFCAKHSSAGV